MEPGESWPLWAVALQDSGLGVAIRHSLWLYPLGNVLHVLGVALFVGAIASLDVRLLGFGRRYVSAVGASKLLTPIAILGVLLLVPGGLIIFIADAGPMAANSLLQLKMLLIVAGLINAWLFRRNWNPRLSDWDATAPFGGRVQTLLSLAIWLAVPTLGRLIAYL
jgi:hypothetical protein